jgi:peroxiredoxin
MTLLLSLSAFAERTKDERKVLFEGATKKLKDSGIEKKIPKVGEKFPDFMIDGKLISEHLKTKPLVITFYRGGWCPYCVKQLKEIDSALGKIEPSAKLIALSPEKESEVRKTKNKNNLHFTMLSDRKHEIARKLNLVFKVDPEVNKEYKLLGLDLESSQGDKSFELPIPATFVIDQNRKVVFAFADADYTKRADTQKIIEAVKKLK